MKNTKVFELIESLGKWERNYLLQFVSSPYFNTNNEVLQILQYILDYLDEKSTLIEKEKVFKAIYNNIAYDDLLMRLNTSTLFRITEDYLAQQKFKNNPLLQQYHLLQKYQEMGNHKLFSSALQDAEKLLEKYSQRDIMHYEMGFKLEEIKYLDKKNQKRTDYDFNKMANNLDVYYVSQKYRFACIALSHAWMGNANSSHIFEHLEHYINSTNPQVLELPEVSIYFYGYKFLSHPELEEYFDKFENLLHNHLVEFPKEEAIDLILLGANYCIRRLNKGQSKYAEKTFQLYKLGISKGAFLEKGFLSRFTFKNIITLGIRVKEFTWTEKFVKDNIKYLEEKFQQSSLAYNTANIAYAKGDYAKTISLLQKADYDDILILLASRYLLMKAYYETKAFESLEYLIGSVQALLRRKRLDSVYTTNYSNICKYMKKLVQHTLNDWDSNRVRLTRLHQYKQSISEAEMLTEKNWYIEQTDKLIVALQSQ
jgi:hypothetical protein